MSLWLPSAEPLPACRLPPATQGVPAPTLIGCELLKSEPSRAVTCRAQEFPAKRRDYTLKTGSVNSLASTPTRTAGGQSPPSSDFNASPNAQGGDPTSGYNIVTAREACSLRVAIRGLNLRTPWHIPKSRQARR